MVAAVPFNLPPPPPSSTRRVRASSDPFAEDQRLVLEDVSWDQYLAITEALGDRSGVRVSYHEGTLELMSPAFYHEDKKTSIGRLVELWSLVFDVPLHGLGSMTYRKKAAERGVEPDECYVLGKATKRSRPDIAIEVAASRSAIDKLDLYKGLAVPELWIWERDRLHVYHLGKHGYREIKRSKLLPALDVEELSRFARMPDQAAAAKAYLKRLQAAR
jgi:Uma2 family endonuclease